MPIATYEYDRFKLFGPVVNMSPIAAFDDKSVMTGDMRGLQQYKTDYYCGSQVSIFLGDVWLDEINMLQFQAQQGKRPFYGYKSKQFDLVATGTQIVQGSFAINYTHANYLNQAVSRWQELSQTRGTEGISRASLEAFIKDLDTLPTLRKSLMYGVDQIVEKQDSPFNTASAELKQKMLEEYFWGVSDTDVPKQMTLAPDDLPSFDIVIAFGNYPNDRLNPKATDEFISSHSTKVINGVHILSYGLIAAANEEPIAEVYTFLARGINHPLTRVPQSLVDPADLT